MEYALIRLNPQLIFLLHELLYLSYQSIYTDVTTNIERGGRRQMIDLAAVGAGIARRRKRIGMTQEDLAQVLNLTAQAVSKWEKGISLPDTSILPKLGYVLGISINELLVEKALPFNETTNSLLFDQNFTSFSFEMWEAADFIPNFTGLPNTLKTVEIDNRNALYIHTAEKPTCKRRGIATQSALTLVPNSVVELTFKPLGDIDGILELWLYDKKTSASIRVAARGGNYGEDRAFLSAVSGTDMRYTRNTIRYGEWQAFHIEVRSNTTAISLLDADRKIIQCYYYDITPAELFQQYHLVISQELGYPDGSNEWHMKAYIEKLQVYVIRT